MADIIDNAAEIEELQRNFSLQKYKSDCNAPSATHCCECGDPIDERRRLAVQGCRTCASCQEDLELISKQRGSK
ncbi:TPA: TraR/DksA family transcriptional regulator [Escherichia coli]|uniref:TraR/DksA family transcriptional regulator n=2 Tax=Escherichia coli TaxID=562 RepID=UPI0002637B2B|nr:TraR/DksA family transcriptional regulator [Escherichia coli]EEC7314597.1 TraR/DksA family transcriptional regulator [Escherichia coli]EED1250941.1 TraR/DksA family transcriptional regulator [Escherichia coli]EER7819498.1 TraR/DksA family transcriptional regulator [Escherichia coli]EET1868383.1 TraR/DksA family transcriptional regulator [Escherichia coli]EEZ7118411.1 TraR/DksA family transcriptional regulator [Escherichia coli]